MILWHCWEDSVFLGSTPAFAAFGAYPEGLVLVSVPFLLISQPARCSRSWCAGQSEQGGTPAPSCAPGVAFWCSSSWWLWHPAGWAGPWPLLLLHWGVVVD